MAIRRHKHIMLSTTSLKLRPMTKVSPPSKGKPYHRIIGSRIEGGREYKLHATKGYRSTIA